jgi:DNA-nicking Smr family endonuclease
MSPPRKGGRRRLSDDEQTLWTTVTRSVAPLRRSRIETVAPDEAPAEPAASAKPVKPVKVQSPPPAPPSRSKPPPLAPLDRRMRQRLAREQESIDRRIDLHGLKQDEAHAALRRFLRGAQAEGARIVLVITGKGARAPNGARDPYDERGVLRRQVPLWLESADLRALIVGFETAGLGHGGEGALYVRIRRAR